MDGGYLRNQAGPSAYTTLGAATFAPTVHQNAPPDEEVPQQQIAGTEAGLSADRYGVPIIGQTYQLELRMRY